MTAPDAAPPEEAAETTPAPAHSSKEQAPARPDLRVVPDEPADPEAEDDGEVAAQAPWQYRLGTAVAQLHDALPQWYTTRPPSWAERVDYSLRGDWTTSKPESGTKRQIHLIGVVLGILVDAALVTPLRWCTTKPSLLAVLIAAYFLLGQLTS